MHRFIARLKVELIVLFGYSVGILILAGFFMGEEFYPQEYFPHDTVLWQLSSYIGSTIPDIYIRTTLALLLLLVLALLVKKAFAIGGPAALIGVTMGFLAGLAMAADPVIGLIMLALGIICAYVSITGWKTLKALRGPRV
jgi:hypothetical protein